MHDAVVKVDTYQNLQRYRAVLPAIARGSCLEHPVKQRSVMPLDVSNFAYLQKHLTI